MSSKPKLKSGNCIDLGALPQDQLLPNEAAATCLGISPITLLNWRYRKSGPAYHKVGRLAFYRVGDLVAWLAKQRREPTEHRAA